jgi:hypothetical protein
MIYPRTKKGIRIAEVWFNGDNVREAILDKPDIVRCNYVDSIYGKTVSLKRNPTIFMDLSRSEEELLADCNKTTRYQINRAKKSDSVETVTDFPQGSSDSAVLDRYIEFYNDFARSKGRGLQSVNRYVQYVTHHTLVIRSVVDAQSREPLAMHSYIVSDGRARLHQSASLFRTCDDKAEQSRIGRANRFLHMDDMLYFKGLGIASFDFGGWYGGTTDTAKLAINSFKESFGGYRRDDFSYIVPLTIRGWLSVLVRAVARKIS